MKFGSVCSGIEAVSAAWEPLGWQSVFFSEIEPFPCSVLARHYPKTPNLGDMTKFKEWPDAAIDVLVGGTPCQSFSVAGLRKGLDDPRGNLMLTFGAIANRYRPTWLVWENVPGVLSSNGGKDFGTFLGMLAELGYGFAYRILDAQFFGVAQRRRRVFVVAHLGDWRAAAAVLFERHSLSGDIAPSREAGQGAAHDIAPSLVSSGRGVERIGESRGQDPVIAQPVTMAHRQGGAEIAFNRGPTLTCNHEAPIVCHGTQDPCVSDKAFALGRNNGQENAIAFVQNSRDEVRLMGGDGSIVGALAAETGAKQQCYVARCVTGDITHTLKAEGFDGSEDGTGRGVPIITLSAIPILEAGARTTDIRAGLGVGSEGDPMFTLRAGKQHGVSANMQVRRLTPVECERLQGFADGYTDVPHRGKPAADGPRYKSLGNSMAVPVMSWIGKRIQLAQEIISNGEAVQSRKSA